MTMDFKKFREAFPFLMWKMRKGKLTDETHLRVIRKYEQEIAKILISLGFVVDLSSHEGKLFVELTHYDKEMQPAYKINRELIIKWRANWGYN